MDADPSASQVDLASLADVARQFGHHAGRAWYSGVRVDPDEALVTIFRRPNHAFDEELLTLLGRDARVRFEDARHTREQLTVAREVAWGLADELQVETISIPDDGSAVNVFVNASVADAQALLDRELPGLATARDARLGATV